jgi:hypothetical protein
MAEETPNATGRFREWIADRFIDAQFKLLVPAVKWSYFSQLIHPMADEPAKVVSDQLFSGVSRPFHYKLARGWMGRVFRRVIEEASDLKAGQSVADGLSATLSWPDATTTYLVFSDKDVFEAAWSDALRCCQRSWLPIQDHLVICSDPSKQVAFFWEGQGPYFEKRAKRKLAAW